MKLGASDYITKPFQPEAIRLVSEKLIERRRLLEEVRELRQRVHEEHNLENILSKSPKMLKVFELIRSLAETDSRSHDYRRDGDRKRVGRPRHT